MPLDRNVNGDPMETGQDERKPLLAHSATTPTFRTSAVEEVPDDREASFAATSYRRTASFQDGG